MKSLNDFLELMDHEFGEIGIELGVYGLKVDGDNNGLKQHCNLNKLKSVDYIYKENNKFPLIEFSDIYRQQNAILAEIDQLKSCDLSRSLRTDLVKERHKKILSELVQKFKDTLTIISKLHNHISDIPENLQNQSQEYRIVYAPFHPEIAEDKKQDLVRFLDRLKDNITTAIPNEMCERVRVIHIANFLTCNS